MASGERAETTQHWDPRGRALISETQYPLEAGLKEVSILLRVGRISVEGVKIGNPKLLTRLIVSAASEDEAKKYLETWQDKLRVHATSGSLNVDGRDEAQKSIRGVNIIGGSFVGGIISTGGGEVWINGQRVDTGVNVPSVQREILLNVAESELFDYRLQIEAGSVEINKTQGEAKISGQSSDIIISGFQGALEIDNQSGNAILESVEGELAVESQSGDVDVNSFLGRATIKTQSGDILFNPATFVNGRSILKTMSGDIRVGVLNDSLSVLASTMSGDIRTPRTSNFTIDRDDRPSPRRFGSSVVVGNTQGVSINIGVGRGGNKSVEGHFGNLQSNDSLNLKTMSGDIVIS